MYSYLASTYGAQPLNQESNYCFPSGLEFEFNFEYDYNPVMLSNDGKGASVESPESLSSDSSFNQNFGYEKFAAQGPVNSMGPPFINPIINHVSHMVAPSYLPSSTVNETSVNNHPYKPSSMLSKDEMLARNRASAAKSRQRKKNRLHQVQMNTMHLQQSSQVLEMEIRNLQVELASLRKIAQNHFLN